MAFRLRVGRPLFVVSGAWAILAMSGGLLPAIAAEQTSLPTSCDATCIRTNMERAANACTPQIEAQAPLDFDWLHRPLPGIFQAAEQPAATDAVVRYRGDLIRFQTSQKDWERMSYECGFDVRAGRLVSLQMHPGRLPANVEPVAASVVLPGAKPMRQARAMPDPRLPPAAAAAPAARKPVPRVGEPSPIEIEQQAPRIKP